MRLNVAFFALMSVAALGVSVSPAQAEGFRAEIHGGWDHVAVDGPGDDSGFMYGIGLGYDFDVTPNAFLGVDFSLDDSTMKDCESSVIVANDRACIRAGRDLAAGIRGGFKVGDAGKLYALAGYTNARFKASYTTPAGVRTSDGENLDGFRLGAGYEHAFGSRTYGKVEYRYSNYENDVTRHQVLLGVGVNF